MDVLLTDEIQFNMEIKYLTLYILRFWKIQKHDFFKIKSE